MPSLAEMGPGSKKACRRGMLRDWSVPSTGRVTCCWEQCACDKTKPGMFGWVVSWVMCREAICQRHLWCTGTFRDSPPAAPSLRWRSCWCPRSAGRATATACCPGGDSMFTIARCTHMLLCHLPLTDCPCHMHKKPAIDKNDVLDDRLHCTSACALHAFHPHEEVLVFENREWNGKASRNLHQAIPRRKEFFACRFCPYDCRCKYKSSKKQAANHSVCPDSVGS